MEDNKDCVLLKRKEYDELLSKINGDTLHIMFAYNINVEKFINRDHYRYSTVEPMYYSNIRGGKIELGNSLYGQIRNISHLITDKLNSDIDIYCEKIRKEIYDIYKPLMIQEIVKSMNNLPRKLKKKLMKGEIEYEQLISILNNQTKQ